jgi:1,5-anhydro-D-fructose reductase (1,5-anhydro-D-mannitol-forming)
MHRPIRWGIVGCGAVTEVKSGPPYRMTQGFVLQGVMRRNLERAKDYAQRHGVPFFTNNASDLIGSPEIDAIYIATPPDTHKKYALMVAQAGKPCCVEKPMAPNYADSLAIHTAFEERKLPLFVAYYRRCLPRFLKVKEWLQASRIGEVRHVEWHKSRSASAVDSSGGYNWRTDANVAPGGYFDDLASHGLDLFTFLLGPIKKASGCATNQQGLYAAYDAITGSWLHENGVTGSGSWIFGARMPKDEVVILGSKGEIRFSVLDEAPLQLTTATENETIFVEHPAHLHQYHVAHMALHLKGVTEHPSTGKTALHTSWVMDKILGAL